MIAANELLDAIEIRVMQALRSDEGHDFALLDILWRIEKERYGVLHYCIQDMQVAKNLTESRTVLAPEIEDMYVAREQQEFLEASG